MATPTLITFVVYLVALMGIGLHFYRRSVSIEDYLLGGRGMGAWVTALSAQASDMSGWLLMGLPGAIYLGGLVNAWIAIGLFIGTTLNWILISGRLRVYTQNTNTITLPCFFEQRFGDPTGLLRVVSAIIILVFFTIYASSGLVAAGKLFESTFPISYTSAVLIGGTVIIAYTFLGGFLAVCWTDLFQGSLMVLALVVVPAFAYVQAGGFAGIQEAVAAKGIPLGLIPRGGTAAVLAVISAVAWGLGYFGQPHILVRFMSVKSLTKLSESMVIAIVWVSISLAGAVAIGWIGIGLFEHLPDGDEEKVFIHMIAAVLHPWLVGVMLAAILSAIMSTIDSQLLVSSSALTEDFYQKAIKRDASQREVVFIGRICVVVISIIAMALALRPNETILRIVAYAWGGFGAAFGPLVLCALFSRRTSWLAALLGMVAGAVTLVVWKQTGLGTSLYELVPGFAANFLVILIVNRFIPQDNPLVLRQFDALIQEIRRTKMGQADTLKDGMGRSTSSRKKEDDMGRMAVDIVLLPDDAMTERAIEFSRRLAGDRSGEIVLNRENCLPHISLAMGGAARADIAAIQTILERIARESAVKRLQITRIPTPSAGSRSGSATVLEVERTDELQALHERVMMDMEPFFRYEVTRAMFQDDVVAPTAMEWVRNYPDKASFAHFSPHITIGYGAVGSEPSFPAPFEVTRLALCHLGNHCTCRSILAAVILR